jgi:hypothetical protein
MRIHPLRQRLLTPAAHDLRFLLSRGYPRDSAIGFVGDHFQLSREERDLLFRGVFTREQNRARKAKMGAVRELAGARLVIDGHNVLITLESALRGRPLLMASDGVVRDISRVFRRFRPTERTRTAWRMVERLLTDYPPVHVTVILDAPLPKSGELAARINRWMDQAGIAGEAAAETRPETAILRLQGIKATADSIIIDRSRRVFDLAGHIIRKRMRAGIIHLPA